MESCEQRKPGMWEEEFDTKLGYYFTDETTLVELSKKKVLDFIRSLLVGHDAMLRKRTAEMFDDLLKEGHGGGNYRRLVELKRQKLAELFEKV